MRKILIPTLLFIGLFLSSDLSAKRLGVNISWSKFQSQGQPYIDLYFAIGGKSLTYAKTSQGKYQGGIEVMMTFSKNDKLVKASKFRIKSELLDDTLSLPNLLMHQERIALDSGKYLMFLELIDMNDSTQAYPVERAFEIGFPDDAISISDLSFLERIEPTQSPNVYTRGNYDFYPLLTGEVAILGPKLEKLQLYAEIYNSHLTYADSALAYRIEIIASQSQQSLSQYGRIKRFAPGEVVPVLYSSPLENLPSGQYELVLQILNSKGRVIAERSAVFLRRAPLLPLSSVMAHAAGINHFGRQFETVDSLYRVIEYLRVISSEEERLEQAAIQEGRDLGKMQDYLYSFWEQKFPGKAEESWMRYLSLVRTANAKFSTRITPGYKTDRGNIMLLYGQPAQMLDRKIEPTLPPYQIWQYHSIQTPWVIQQTNKVFVFAEFQHSSNDYELIHSNAIGELQNHRWQYQLANGKLGNGGNIDNSRIDMGDESGSQLNNNTLIINDR